MSDVEDDTESISVKQNSSKNSSIDQVLDGNTKEDDCGADGDNSNLSTEEDEDEPLIYLDDDTLKLNEHIEERIRTLQKTMLNLKRELTEEKDAWKREIDELAQLQEQQQCSDCDCESFSSPCITDSEPDTSCHIPEPAISESILDYENKLLMYQRTLQSAQKEKRYQIRRQLAANAYKKRLLEVENMCNMELLRLKQSVQYLQPLQQLAAEWDFRHSDAGDANRFLFTGISSTSFDFPPIEDINKICTEQNFSPPMECFGSRLYEEMTKMARAINEPIMVNHTKDAIINTDQEDGVLLEDINKSQSDIWTKEDDTLSPTTTTASLP